MIDEEPVVPDWVDKLLEDRLSKKADDNIQSQKHAIAVAATARIKPLILKLTEESVEKFSRAIGGVEGPVTSPFNGYTRFRTSKPPLRVVEFGFAEARILFRIYQDDRWNASEEAINIRGEFNEEPWFEHNGERLNTIEQVSELLLRSLFESVK